MYKIMYKFAGKWYPLISNAHIIYFFNSNDARRYAQFLEDNFNKNWSEWFCAFDEEPNREYIYIKEK